MKQMDQKLFTETRPLYVTSRESPHVIRCRIRMRDLIDSEAFRHAVDTTMQRYPYFCVELQRKNGDFYFAENHRPIVITNSLQGVELNSADSNFHMIAFCWQDNWIILDVFHGLTDGTGAYEVLRTLLHYYCSERYHVELNDEGVRLVGDEIPEEEWVDPVVSRADLPTPSRNEMPAALNLIDAAGLEDDRQNTVYSIAISESEFMRFTLDNDGSPGTTISLLLSRAIAKLFPDAEGTIRIALCVNQRHALGAPLAHQSLVGGVMLEYKDKMRDWPLDRQGTIYRGMVFAQTVEETVLAGVATQAGMNRMLLSKESDQERLEVMSSINALTKRLVTATVSYVGKATYRGAERYIRDFRAWTSSASNGLLVEVSAVNGRFTLDLIQHFSSPIVVNAFLKQLEDNGIVYDLQDVQELDLPNVKLPWTEGDA
ncbi:MAG: hypothetical protein IJ087_07965 [Eggerthellaceae bacterium]|nr:hypothetical protein [Eggerthellaceae bacterium]